MRLRRIIKIKRSKRNIVLSVILVIVISASAFLFGCNKKNDVKEEVSETLPPLATPALTVVGNTVVWEPVEGADTYEVYQNDSVVTKQYSGIYISQ